ncbi:MAG: HlyD family efflux transporter periplasmic adaptor subunit [Candidatus Neomarinimicrobiota bacterium]
MKKFKFKQTRKINWYVLLWAASILIAVYLFFNWHIEKNLLGIVERRTHIVGAQESGRVQTLLVEPGDKVTKDQLLAVLYFSDLKSNLENLRTELGRLQKMESARRNAYTMQVERMRLQLDNEASDLLERLAMIESKSAELAGVNALIQRLQSAQDAGLGYNRDLAELNIQRDALLAYLKELRRESPDRSDKADMLSESNRSLHNANIDDMSEAMLAEGLKHTEELRRQIVETEHRISLRTLVAPCDGYVTQVIVGQGDVVKAFDPILTVEESHPSRLIVYIPEHSTLQPEIGNPVRIYSSRSKKFATTGTVSFIHPGFTRAEDRISFRGQIFWARKVQVDLNTDHQLVPGEVVTVRIANNGNLISRSFGINSNVAAAESSASSIKHDPDNSPPVKDMDVPRNLWSATSFEPSGVAWSPELKEFLLVSDDTGINESTSEHAPYIFRMNELGNVDPQPQKLTGIASVNDLEGITAAGNDTFYLISSQNISKKGRRPVNREFLLKIIRKDSGFIVQDKVNLLTLILQAYPPEELKQLGLSLKESDQRPEINIEGIAYDGQTLYFGLKQPISETGAIIWKLENPQTMFDAGKIEPGQFTLFGTVNLKGPSGKPAGISDMCFDLDGKLWALSTIPDAGQKEQLGALHRIDRFTDGRLEAKTIVHFPGLKPEGLCFQGRTRLLIVFDKDNETPAYCFIDPEQL